MCFCISRSEPGNLTPVRDSPAIPRLRSVNSYTNIRTATTARNLNKSLQNLNLNEEGKTERQGAECWQINACEIDKVEFKNDFFRRVALRHRFIELIKLNYFKEREISHSTRFSSSSSAADSGCYSSG